MFDSLKNLAWHELILFMAFCVFVIFYTLSLVMLRKLEEIGVKFIKPLPLFGNLLRTICGKDHFTVPVKSVYDSYPNDRYVVLFELLKPTIILKDQELIKTVTVRDFDSFQDTPLQIDEGNDPVLGRILLSLKGEKWRQMRSTLSPAFTPSKMKNMFNFMTACSSNVVKFYTEQVEVKSGAAIDMSDICRRFTIDVIASAAFSFEVDSLSQRKNKFYDEATNLSGQTVTQVSKSLAYRLFPRVMKFLRLRFMPKASTSYFKDLLHRNMTERETSNEYRPDMIHLLTEAKKGKLKHEETADSMQGQQFAAVEELHIGLKADTIKWSEDDCIAQCIMFIIAGHTTTSTIMSFLMYELAVNPDIQTRLQEEVDSVLEENGGKLSYDCLLKMEYMDMVVSECLRKWPTIPFISRVCRQNYDLGPVRKGCNQRMQMEKGDTVFIPVYAIHMDAKFWPKPEKFDPERFSEKNKKNIKPFTYLPFGSGPRNCIGSHFALMEIKILACSLLSKFSMDVCAKTQIPMILSTKTLFLDSKYGFWISMKPWKRAS